MEYKPGIYVVKDAKGLELEHYDGHDFNVFGSESCYSIEPMGEILAGPFTVEEIYQKMSPGDCKK